MKRNQSSLLAFFALTVLLTSVSKCNAQGTGFTYQGRLTDNGSPANGNYDLRCALFDAASGSGQVGNPVTNAPVTVSNGLFTVALDFGAGVFTGAARWLEIGVRTNGSADAFTALDPRQSLTATPYAVRAANFGGAVSDGQLSANIARLNSNATFTGAVQFNNAAGNFAGGFTGDGAGLTNLDLFTIDSHGAIFFANSAATFTLASSPLVGYGPFSVVAADVNGDGKLDLISANYFADTLSVLTNNGSGGFVLASSPSVGSGPASVTAADVNGDGKLDLISANYDTNTLTVLTNNSTGGFVLASSPSVGSGPESVTAADVNGDGKVDLISANYGDRTGNTLTVLTNNGSGGFALASSPTVGSAPYSVTAADVNADGKVDLISANNWSSSTLTVLINNGSGGFARSDYIVGSGPYSVTAADVNGDGTKDLISANSGGNTLSVLTNNGSGGFLAASEPFVGSQPVSVTTADVNRDGKVDLICANRSSDTLSVLINIGSDRFILASSPAVGSRPQSVTAADVNGDGEVDLISANSGQTVIGGISGYTLSVLFGDRQANFVGNGAGLTSLSAANLTGTISDARLSANVALRAGGNSFTGNQSVTGNQTVIGRVGIGTSSPVGNLDVVTGGSTVSIRSDAGVAPGMVMTGGVAPGTLRLRNILEVWPNTGGTAAGRLDVRNTSGVATITLNGNNGNITCVTLNQTSDRNAKENFVPVKPQEVLEKVAALPLSTWNYKSQDTTVRHLGPMAQDFRAAFSLGENDTTITTVDADGVALAAIQGLNDVLKAKEERIQALEKSLAELKEMMGKISGQQNGGAR